MKTVTRTVSGASALSAAIGLAMAMQGTPTSADGMKSQVQDHAQRLAQMQMQDHPQGMQKMQDDPQVMAQMQKFIRDKMQKEHLEMCYGINVAAKNDCGTAAHSCMGQATKARDPASFVLVPMGACAKIDGGSLKPA
jgi:Predicted integral membrane protein (DUF2282)